MHTQVQKSEAEAIISQCWHLFSNECLEKRITSVYTKLNIPDRNVKERNTKEAVQLTYIKNETKFLFKKKCKCRIV
jgi:hypothetical protein